jgi:hypothetical protein
MTATRSKVLLLPVGILAATAQLLAGRWGLTSILAGGVLAGGIVLAGERLLSLEVEPAYLSPLVSAAASLLGLGFGEAGSGLHLVPEIWIAPLLALAVPGSPALIAALRAKKCQLCHASLRRLLSFQCPRCHLLACENCWQFERGRCRLCEANQIPLFPSDFRWWQERFGSPVQGGRCALCLRTADWKAAHWSCAGCGHSQCSTCWDDNNGQCSRCGWTLPDLPADVSEYVLAGSRRENLSHRS